MQVSDLDEASSPGWRASPGINSAQRGVSLELEITVEKKTTKLEGGREGLYFSCTYNPVPRCFARSRPTDREAVH